VIPVQRQDGKGREGDTGRDGGGTVWASSGR
jgi:hypothetical protein